jgi:transcription-repair coupling factor (superfamily II helicase)
MDNLKNEDELKGFLKKLADRFGPVPTQVDKLAYSFKLRWLAQELGVERLILKSEKMIGYFVANPKSAYYESPIFTKVLDYASKNPRGVKLSEKNDRLRIIYSNVNDLEDARNRLQAVLKL